MKILSKNTCFSDNPENLYTALLAGKVCVFETDTVVGLGCSVWINQNKKHIPNIEGLKKLYKIKGRNFNKPISWLIDSWKEFKAFCQPPIQPYVDQYAATKWPGAYTFIVRTNKNVPESFTGKDKNNNSTLGIRIPDSTILQKVISTTGSPISCTSANISNYKPVNHISDVNSNVINKSDFVFTRQIYTEQNTKQASQVIDCTNSEPIILRN